MPVLSPSEALSRFKEEIPEDVIESWNEEIISNLKVYGDKMSSRCLYPFRT